MKHFSFLALALAGLCVWPATADTVSYVVTVNTTSLNGTYGYIEIQMNPGSFQSAPVDANVVDFQGATTNTSDPNNYVAGTVIGSLDSGDLLLSNYAPPSTPTVNSQPSDYVEGVNFTSNQISFLLTLSGTGVPPAGTQSGSQFVVDFLDAGESNYLLTTDPTASNAPAPPNYDPDWYAGVVDVDPVTGAVTPNGSGGGVNAVTFSAVPEPSFALPVLAACALIAVSARRRRRLSKM